MKLRLPLLPAAALAILTLLAGAADAAPGALPVERWRVESFTDVLSGGPETGPALQARGEVDSQCTDGHGNIYLASGYFVDIITRDGRRYHLAGTGYPGMRDGPAANAEFRMGLAAGYGFHNIACTADGQVFVADVANGLVRRIFRGKDGWRVETWAGGGRDRLVPGEGAPSHAVALSGNYAVVALPNGEVLVGVAAGYYRISANGTRIRSGGRWPDELAAKGRKGANLGIASADIDEHSNAYFLSRGPNVVVRVRPDGATDYLAGIARHEGGPKPHQIGDGPPREIFLDATSSLAASPTGEAVYVCGGDEYDIRRIPTDGTSRTATLMQNGRWYAARVHPNLSRGAAIYLPTADGALQPDGPLTIMRVSPITGRDAAGNLYGKLNHWSGVTQYIQGEGLLSTRVFRIRRADGAGG